MYRLSVGHENLAQDQEAVLDFKVKTCTPSYCLVIELEQQKSEKLLKYVSLLS